MNVKAATEQDASFLFELFASQKIAELGLDHLEPSLKNSIISMQWNARNQSYLQTFPGMKHFIIMHNNEPVGSLVTNDTLQEIHIIDILISPSFRNLGIGTLLLKQLQSDASQQNVPLRLHVALNNAAKRLYERMGFYVYQQDSVYLSMQWLPNSLSFTQLTN
ncbi:GNAT family N-acetyltransferase [Paenibacillus sp. WLX1005]|uniref:GNAT family N-acetyltransferase n=1 Tax=Paenibacillus sp. WLX1005 TaxID=3243766 RepID=UPI003983EF74